MSQVPGYSSSTGQWYHHRSQILHSLLNTAPVKRKRSARISALTQKTLDITADLQHVPQNCEQGHIPARLLEPQHRADLRMQNWADPMVCGLYLALSSCLCLELEAPARSPALQRLDEEQHKRQDPGNSNSISRRTSPHTYQEASI